MKNYSYLTAGFSLVEVLVAISILLIAITGPMKILTNANRSTAFASEQVNAWFLAQEGLELVQKGRDDLLLGYFFRQINAGVGGQASPFAQFRTNYAACFAVSKCGVMINSTAGSVNIRACTATACRLYTDTSPTVRPVYLHTAAPTPTQTVSLFTRMIQMSVDPNNANEIIVTSTVSWRTGSFIADQQVQVVTRLFNIYDTP